MIRIAAILLLLLLLPLAVPAHAVTDSVTTAIEIVNDFYADAHSLTHNVPQAQGDFASKALKDKEDTVNGLRSIGWAKKPSRGRYETVREIVQGYTSGVIKSVEALKTGLPKGPAEHIDEITRHLKDVQALKLETLGESLKIETFEKKGPKPVPLIDRERTPFENRPDEAPGIWYR